MTTLTPKTEEWLTKIAHEYGEHQAIPALRAVFLATREKAAKHIDVPWSATGHDFADAIRRAEYGED